MYVLHYLYFALLLRNKEMYTQLLQILPSLTGKAGSIPISSVLLFLSHFPPSFLSISSNLPSITSPIAPRTSSSVDSALHVDSVRKWLNILYPSKYHTERGLLDHSYL